jgi:hypothetical protein
LDEFKQGDFQCENHVLQHLNISGMSLGVEAIK